MSFFEQELRRLVGACNGVINPTFAGRACFGELGGDNRVKLQFITLGTHERYEAIKATILSRSEGEVDSLLFRFSDTWGKKQLNNPNFREGLIPYAWTYNGKTEWYAYRPTDADIKKLAAELDGYIGVFADRSLVADKAMKRDDGKGSVMKTIREAKQNTVPRKNTPVRNKTEPDL